MLLFLLRSCYSCNFKRTLLNFSQFYLYSKPIVLAVGGVCVCVCVCVCSPTPPVPHDISHLTISQDYWTSPFDLAPGSTSFTLPSAHGSSPLSWNRINSHGKKN